MLGEAGWLDLGEVDCRGAAASRYVGVVDLVGPLSVPGGIGCSQAKFTLFTVTAFPGARVLDREGVPTRGVPTPSGCDPLREPAGMPVFVSEGVTCPSGEELFCSVTSSIAPVGLARVEKA